MRRALRGVSILLGLAGAALTVPLVLGFLGRLHPLFASLAHFRLHLAVAVAGAGLVLLAVRGWRRNGAAMAALAAAAAFVTLWPAAGNRAADTLPQPSYRLLHLNLRFDNPRPDLFLALLEQQKPDVVTLAEVSPGWAERLAATEAAYPYRLICPERSYIGVVAILSRLPFASEEARCTRGGSLAVATVDFNGRPAAVAALHLMWPWPFGQDRQVARLAPLLAGLGPRALVGGDFNATPWSESVRMLAAAGGLRLAPWAGPSYLDRRLPAWLRPLAGLPIDHVLVKGDIVTGAVSRLAPVGSDHLPVLFEFAIGEPPPAVQTAGRRAG